MRISINFNNQFLGSTIEICDVIFNNALTEEFL